MAGDWIKMRSDLFTHPKVVRISSALKADTLRTVGGLMSVWCLFDNHSVDGTLEGYVSQTLDDHLRWPGFSAAMIAVGWLQESPESLTLPSFDTHNGQSAKRRSQDADRKKDVRKASASDADKKRTREEKRREEYSVPKGTADDVGPPSADDQSLGLDSVKPLMTDPDEIIFSFGVQLIVRSGKSEANARSFLGKLRKVQGDEALVNALRGCAKAKAIEPMAWLTKALPETAKHSGFEKLNYSEGINANGTF